MSNIEQELQILKETKVQIKDAIKAKGQEVLDDDSFRSYAEKINNVITLEEGTSDADANFKDLIAGKTAYVNGEKITGNIKLYNLNSSTAFTRAAPFKSGSVGLGLEIICSDYRYAFEQDSKIRLATDNKAIASLLEISSDQIVIGNTILGVEGTAELGIDTSDATATADTLMSGKTAYVKGQKITGNVYSPSSGSYGFGAPVDNNVSYGATQMKFSSHLYNPILLKKDFDISISASIENVVSTIGLTADKIKTGETILGITGTYEGSGGLDTSSDNPITASDVAEGKEGFVNGEKITGAMPKASAENAGGELEAIEVNDEAVIFNAEIGGIAESIVYLPDAEFETVQIPMAASLSNLAEVIGLTADKIKKGETILGIEGTYEGSFEETLTPDEYTDAIDLTDDILNNNEEV